MLSEKKKDNDDNKIIDPCDLCFCDDKSIDNNEKAATDISVSPKLEKNINNSSQDSNREDSNCVIVIHSSSNHTGGIDNDNLDTYGHSYVNNDIDTEEFEHNDFKTIILI